MQKMIEFLLEDCTNERGLKTHWKDVDGIIHCLQINDDVESRDRPIVSDDFIPHKQSFDRPSNVIPKSDDLGLDDLIK